MRDNPRDRRRAASGDCRSGGRSYHRNKQKEGANGSDENNDDDARDKAVKAGAIWQAGLSMAQRLTQAVDIPRTPTKAHYISGGWAMNLNDGEEPGGDWHRSCWFAPREMRPAGPELFEGATVKVLGDEGIYDCRRRYGASDTPRGGGWSRFGLHDTHEYAWTSSARTSSWRKAWGRSTNNGGHWTRRCTTWLDGCSPRRGGTEYSPCANRWPNETKLMPDCGRPGKNDDGAS